MEASNFMHNKWTATVLGIWIQCICGASYTFSIYSSALKSTQSYDQSTLDTVSVFKDIGANAGIISGFLYSAVTPLNPRRAFAGPWMVHAAGAIQWFLGYIFIWAAVSGVIDRPPVPAMCFFMFLAAHAQTFFNTANVVTGVHNFANYSGTIVGIMKGYLGLSGALLIQVYNTTCNADPSNFLLMLAVLPTVLSIMFMWFVRIDKTESKNEMKHLNSLSALAVIVAFYLMVVIILNNAFSLSSWTRYFTFSILLILLAAPLGIAINAQKEDFRGSPPSLITEESHVVNKPEPIDAEDSVEYHELPREEDQIMVVSNSRAPQPMNVLEAIRTINFWLLFLAMVCGMGSGLATINNMSQLGQSLGYTATETKTFVSLWSIWNFLGRFGAGYTSDFLFHTYGWARPLLMAITLLIMSGGHIVIASGFSGNLYVGSILVGICYGSQWSLMPTITSEIFGLEHMGTIFNTIAIASPLGSYIFSVRVIGYIYDREAAGEHGACSGTHCFVVSFLVMAIVAFLGFLVAAALFFRTRRFYRLALQRRVECLS
ncbi:protein NUCLEAR FUSION DEFECTIVE 4 [Cucumis melo var. makuwa]|uniref:Protein NUCLEAR FUSION DEFECTIVE 4 n=2 Tax=Cucumis melo TaxID=3656 RepID=A0A1S3BWC2_CUCME|nr:protein NUCLEAR FUSION DEFECTIVE 4 [Cucumis melo]KAA0057917.1 protein NUCLEAR FUSION DEFECTIVE 4 [Cucumis melo var. makuwa]TYJ98605.1 protein NUCLEAR FUSION DEFECTIVE 4 [Cucumis melo var. makuwa]